MPENKAIVQLKAQANAAEEDDKSNEPFDNHKKLKVQRRTTPTHNQGSLWQGTTPQKWETKQSFPFLKMESIYSNNCGQASTNQRPQWHYLHQNHQEWCGADTLQCRRPGWPECRTGRGMASPDKVPMAGQPQGMVPSSIGRVPFKNSWRSFLSPFSPFSAHQGQLLPKHYIGSSKELNNGKVKCGMPFSSENSKPSVGSYKEAQAPFHMRLRHHIKWWEVHSSKEVQNMIKCGVAAAVPLPPIY